MKNKFAFIAMALIYSFLGFSQGSNGRINSLEAHGINLSQAYFRGANSSTQGSPYLNKAFLNAKVGTIVQNVLMRYNASNDEFEFITATNDTLILNKTGAFGDIIFTIPKANYQFVNYTERDGKTNTGYLIRLLEKNDLILYKRQKIKYYPATAAKTSYDTSSPAKFVPVEDTFFLKNKDGDIRELPTNKKGFIKLYPEKKADIEAFIKQNDIDFDKEADMVKLIDFLAT